MSARRKKIFAFIDAANLFYGGEKSLGWKIDYQKLFTYLKHHYGVTKVYYYGGVELAGFSYSILKDMEISLSKLLIYLQRKLREKDRTEAEVALLGKYTQRVKFYQKLEDFGYTLRLKPVKVFRDAAGGTVKKANCDVDLTFDVMRYKDDCKGVLILSGDGDFAVLIKYLKKQKKRVTVLARGERTAREIRQLMGGEFRDFGRLRKQLEFIKK